MEYVPVADNEAIGILAIYLSLFHQEAHLIIYVFDSRDIN